MELDYYTTIKKIILALVTGILCAYVIIYALRPSVPYPDIILELFDNNILFIILLISNFYLFLIDKLIGTLFLTCIISLVFDYYIFIKNEKKIIHEPFIDYKTDENIINFKYNIKNNILDYINKLF
jgi:hypothetical protein